MRPSFFSLILICFVSFSSHLISAGQEPTQEKKECATLSELGIDFGAAELGRYAELGLSETQKKDALNVVRTRKPKIENLCERMTKALAMEEKTIKEKKAKELELAAIQERFKDLQNEIITKLHSLVTKDQMAKLQAMKKREQVEAQEEAKASKRQPAKS